MAYYEHWGSRLVVLCHIQSAAIALFGGGGDSVRCLSVLDLVILFYLFIFFLGREAQKVCEWGVNSLKTSIFPLPKPLRGCRSLLEIVFCRTV